MVHNAGSYIWVHCHGKVRNLIEKFIEMGVDVLNPLEPPKNGDVDLDEVARTFKNRIGLEGNIEMQDFYDESEEVIREKIKTCVQSGKQSNRFIMCTSAGFMDFPTPSKQYLDNIMTYIDYGYECVNNARY
jgi:uroporphyrinogen decarboxylase